MNYHQACEILGVAPECSPEQVHRAYKRLALRLHPDRAAGNSAGHAAFCRVTEAYAVLRQAAGGGAAAQTMRHQMARCPRCGHDAVLAKALDGGCYCHPCLLNTRRRFLPLPSFVVIRCISTIALLLLAAACAIQSALSGDRLSAYVGAGLVLSALGTLAHHVRTADIISP